MVFLDVWLLRFAPVVAKQVPLALSNAKEISKNIVIYASIIPIFYENCLGSEQLQNILHKKHIRF
jgi:hypothetical protein